MSYHGSYTPLTYERMKKIHETVKPYRDTNQYPYVTRTHRHKFFEPVEVNGEVEYHMSYYWGWKKECLDHAEFEQASQYMTKHELSKWNVASPEYNEGQSFNYKYVKTTAPYGILRKDNTLEMLCTDMHQGLRMHLTDMLRGVYVMTDCLSGGAIITNTWREFARHLKIPMFKGLRFNVETFDIHESSRYIINVKRVDRKKSNEIMKAHKDKFDIIKSFYKTMDVDTFKSELQDTAKQHLLCDDGNYARELLDNAPKKAIESFNDDPMLASYLILIGRAYGNCRWVARDGDKPYYPIPWYANHVERNLKNDLKHLHDTFMHVKYWDFDKTYPQTKWDIELHDMQGNRLKQL